MSEASEARQWARDNGYDVNAKGPVSPLVLDAWRATLDAEPPIDIELPPVVPSETEAVLPPSPAAEEVSPHPPRRPETPPRGRKVNVAERFRSKTTAGAKRKRPRVSIEDLVQGGWALAGYGLTRVEAMVPVGRVLMYQSGVAGIIAEEQFKGTAVDRILQPLARAGEQGKTVMALAGPPVLVGLITANPEMMPVLRPFLHMALASWAEIAGPAWDKAQKRAERMATDLGDFDPDALINAFFADLPEAQFSEAEEEAIRRAQGGNG